MRPDPPAIEIDTDRRRLDLATIHDFLRRSYWAENVPLEVFERSVANSLCFGAYERGSQVGFARVVTDCATFAYLADVFVLESHRGRGIARALMAAVLGHPDVQGLRRWVLATRDAHGLYRQFGFSPLARPERFMELHDPDVYRGGETPSR
jgi:GNAT superfamily N-acetyltransferase